MLMKKGMLMRKKGIMLMKKGMLERKGMLMRKKGIMSSHVDRYGYRLVQPPARLLQPPARLHGYRVDSDAQEMQGCMAIECNTDAQEYAYRVGYEYADLLSMGIDSVKSCIGYRLSDVYASAYRLSPHVYAYACAVNFEVPPVLAP